MIKRWIASAKALFDSMMGRSGKKNTEIVIVGMAKSRKYGTCAGADVDAEAMRRILKNYGKTSVLANGGATRASFMSAMQDAMRKPLCILYYSGHGTRMKDKKGEGGYSEALCLDDGPFHDYELWSLVMQAKGRVFMIFDCCHSGTMYRSTEGGQTPVAESLAPDPDCGFRFCLAEKYMTRSAGINLLVWSGCPAEGLSYGDNTGGTLTWGIRNGYRKNRTYDDVWAVAKYAAKEQSPVRTKLGDGFARLIFR